MVFGHSVGPGRWLLDLPEVHADTQAPSAGCCLQTTPVRWYFDASINRGSFLVGVLVVRALISTLGSILEPLIFWKFPKGCLTDPYTRMLVGSVGRLGNGAYTACHGWPCRGCYAD